MSLLDLLKPKWKHGDPAVRMAAVAAMSNQSTLARIATEDPSEEVRVAATRRLTEKEVIAWLASSAESPRVREAAVGLVNELPLLRRAAACDESAWVRGRARLRAKLAPNLRDRIAAAVERLAVTPPPTEAPDFSGTAEAVVVRLLTDPRFCLNGQLAGETEPAADTVEFLAAARSAGGDPCEEAANPVSFLLSVSRQGPDAFAFSLRQHRYEMASNAAALGWHHGHAREARGDAGGKPAGG